MTITFTTKNAIKEREKRRLWSIVREAWETKAHKTAFDLARETGLSVIEIWDYQVTRLRLDGESSS